MKRLMILNIMMVAWVFSAFAQKTIETYDVNDDKQTTVIIKDTGKSDQNILDELDLDDYTVGEEVYITQEMWDKMQEKKEKEKSPKVNEAPVKEEIVLEEKIAEKPARAIKAKTTSKSKSTSKAKKKKKKSKKYKVKKQKRRKVRSSRRGKMACYSF